jgi:glycosyltransferase involved in cell wall biosynthesis
VSSIREEDTADQIPLTVVIITYNHESFIREALDSVIAQETSFPFEIIISEDRSTDSTREIVEEYRDRYPGWIRLMLSETNLHNNDVGTRGILAARGKYIAFLDGDDYWVSKDKLQKQFEFMESHPDSAVTYHQVYRIAPDGVIFAAIDGLDHRGTVDDAILDCFLPACSAMYRRSAMGIPPEWIRDLPAGDWPMAIIAAEKGYIDKVEGPVAHYRWHANGAWLGQTLVQRALSKLVVLDAVEAHLASDHREAYRQSRAAAVQQLKEAVQAESTEVIRDLRTVKADQQKLLDELWKRLDYDKRRLRRRAYRIAGVAVLAILVAVAVTWVVARSV